MKMTSKLMTLSTLFAVALFFTAAARAATVTYTLEIDPGAKTYEVFAEVSGGSFGLAAYGVPLVGVDTPINHVSPKATVTNFFDIFDGVAFDTIRSDPNTLSLTATQNTINGLYIIGGFGQSASNFAAEVTLPSGAVLINAIGDPWDARLLLANGTFTGNAADVDIDTSTGGYGAAVFGNDSLDSVEQATKIANVVIIPEPGQLMLLLPGLAVLAVLAQRRGRRRASPAPGCVPDPVEIGDAYRAAAPS